MISSYSFVACVILLHQFAWIFTLQCVMANKACMWEHPQVTSCTPHTQSSCLTSNVDVTLSIKFVVWRDLSEFQNKQKIYDRCPPQTLYHLSNASSVWLPTECLTPPHLSCDNFVSPPPTFKSRNQLDVIHSCWSMSSTLVADASVDNLIGRWGSHHLKISACNKASFNAWKANSWNVSHLHFWPFPNMELKTWAKRAKPFTNLW